LNQRHKIESADEIASIEHRRVGWHFKGGFGKSGVSDAGEWRLYGKEEGRR